MGRRMTKPRGIRNNNPGNIELGQKWQGLSAKQTDGRFCQFDNPVMGIRAIMKILLTYQRKYKLMTVKAIIGRWAPAFENDVDSYAMAVSKHLGLRGERVNLDERATLAKFAEAIVRHENGKPPKGTPDYWYEPSIYQQAADLAY